MPSKINKTMELNISCINLCAIYAIVKWDKLKGKNTNKCLIEVLCHDKPPEKLHMMDMIVVCGILLDSTNIWQNS